MQVEWYGQSAFRLDDGERTVFIDPFGDISKMGRSEITFEYPLITGVRPDLALITHEHFDHNAVEVLDGDPVVLRSTAGRLSSPIGEVLAVASEHDEHAGTERGPNTIFVFELDGLRLAHFGDFGQSSLREEQAEAIGTVDMVIAPAGGGPTIGAEGVVALVERLRPRWLVPMHYRTRRVSFLEPLDGLLELLPGAHRLDGPSFDTSALPDGDGPLLVVPAAP